jgi:uncharacterized membrane protein YgaE (UPF0421/DUF939 family)
VLLAALTLLGGGEIVAQSVTQARKLVVAAPKVVGAVLPTDSVGAAHADTSSQPGSQTLSPTMALAIQAVVAAVAAGLIAKVVGNEQSLVVAWTAFVVIAGSAGLSTRRAWVRLPATILGAVGGVAIAAFVPDNHFWTVAVVVVGVFFTIVSAPVSYPAMVFWMSIAFVPLFATEGRYLDLIRDKSVAALIGGCVAAVVALTIVPIRTSREIRPAVLTYLDALDAALASQLPGREESTATTLAELDSAHAALAATAASAATETNVFAQPQRVMNEEAVLVHAVHEAYLRLTPLLSDSSRLLHGWTDERVETGIQRLRDAVESATAAARGDAVESATSGPGRRRGGNRIRADGRGPRVHRDWRHDPGVGRLASARRGFARQTHRAGTPAWWSARYAKPSAVLAATYVSADETLPAGDHQVRMEFTYDGGGLGKGDNVSLYLDGTKIADGHVPRTHTAIFSSEVTTDVGRETGSPVAEDYPDPAPSPAPSTECPHRHRRRRPQPPHLPLTLLTIAMTIQ